MKITSKQLVLFIAHEFAAYTSDVEKHFNITKDQALRILHRCPGVDWEDVNGNWSRGMKSNKVWQINGDEQHMTDEEAVAYITARNRDPNEVLLDTDVVPGTPIGVTPKEYRTRKTIKAARWDRFTADGKPTFTVKQDPAAYMAWVRSKKH